MTDSNSFRLEETIVSPVVVANGQPVALAPINVPENASAKSKGQKDELKQIGRYVVQGHLEQGAFGTVYLANDETLRRKVAIKAPRLDVLNKSVEQDFFSRGTAARTAQASGNRGGP
ncbi:MAG: hypothetical protein NT013_31315 [Planctomycetia bacterium]|nr:hypothetical protein [Planctomycetia bacterium]